MKLPNPLPLLLILVALIAYGCCTGCTPSKNLTKKKETVDSTASEYRDTFSVKKKEVAKVEKKDTSSKKETVETGKVKVEFETDTTGNTKPVVIISKGDTTTIDAGGRKIKTVAVKSSKSNKDSTGANSSVSSHSKENDSTGAKEGKKVQLKKDSSEKVVHKKGVTLWQTIWSFWWLWLILIGWLVYRFRNKLPWA